VALVTVAAPLTGPAVVDPPPPYLALVLEGDDVCRPVLASADASAGHALYQCASGATVVAQPVAGPEWTATVRQPGIPDRDAPLIAVWR
jgi:hypothetical protein